MDNNELPYTLFNGKVYQLILTHKAEEAFDTVCKRECHLHDQCDATEAEGGGMALLRTLGADCSLYDEVNGDTNDKAAVWKEID